MPAASGRLRAIFALTIVAIVWGVTFIVVKRAVQDLSTILFITVRFALAAVMLMAVLHGRWWPGRETRRYDLRAGFFIGICLFTGYVLQTLGLESTTVAKAGFITGFYIPLVPFLSAIVYKKAPGVAEILGILLATAGIILMTLPDERISVNQGDLLVLAATVAFAAHVVVLGHYSGKAGFATLSVLQVAACAVFGALTFWWLETPRYSFTPAALAAIVVSALFATALAFILQSWAQQHTNPTQTALILSTEPVFAWMAAYAVNGETLSGRAGFGAVLILAGLICAEVKPVWLGGHPSVRGRGKSQHG